MEESFTRRIAHELFTSTSNGSTPFEIFLAVFPIFPGSAIASLYTINSVPSVTTFMVEYALCILPLILGFTLLSEHLLEFNLVFLLSMFLIKFFMEPHINFKNQGYQPSVLNMITSCRASLSTATIIAILGVDFHVFPRRFAKTQSFGFSLMDLGAPSYLFMNGLTDGKKQCLSKRRILRDFVVLGTLGLIRLSVVTIMNYQHPLTEYGTHGNFFFTLAAVKILCSWWVPQLTLTAKFLICALGGLVHELFLGVGVSQWVLSDSPREEFIEANREWFASLPGSLCIYLFGVSFSHFLFHVYKPRSDVLVLWSVSLSVLSFAFFLHWILGFPVSRRLANLSFTLWVVGFLFTFLAIFESSERAFRLPPTLLMKAVNHYSLPFFLLGNVLTGIINLSLNTMELDSVSSFVILNFYAVASCGTVYVLKFCKKS